MFIDLNEIGQGEFSFDEALELPGLSGDGGRPLLDGPARLGGVARPGRRGVDLEASLATRVHLECSRCLEAFEIPLQSRFRLTLVADAAEFGVGETEMDQADASLFYAEAGRVDLRAVASEQILLNLPLKPVCAPACRGLCPTCGANRNRIKCDCRRSEVDPRLEPLLRLKKSFGRSRAR